MIERVLLAVDDSPDSLAATRLAITLTGQLHARLRAVHVSPGRLLDTALATATGRPPVDQHRHHPTATILRRVTSLASAAGLDVETELLAGDIAPAVLDAARAWPADLVILGRSAQSLSGEPYVGTQARQILEFADQPVLVVPPHDPAS